MTEETVVVAVTHVVEASKRPIYVEAQGRVRSEKQPDPVPPVPRNAKVRRLCAQYAKHRKLARKAENALSAMNLQPKDESGGVNWSYTFRRRLEEKPSTTRQKRMAGIARLRVQATIDTMDMTPVQARIYLLAFERRLGKA